MRVPKAIIGATLTALALTACGNASGGADDLKVGIVNLVSHPALDAAQEGFVEGLAEAGYEEGKNLTLDIQNASGDQSTLTSIAGSFATGDHDVYYAIATPSAQALSQVITDRPIVFAAVTDPVAAGLVSSWESPDANVTGVSDLNPMDAQVELIREVVPDARSVGIVYSSGEVNSEVQVKDAEAAAKKLDMQVVTKTVTNSSEVQQAAAGLEADAILVPTDNVVVSAAESVVQVAEERGIPVFASDEATMERGAAAGLSVNYTQQGKDAAKLAVELAKGKEASELPVEKQTEFDLFVNAEAAKRQGVTLPEAVIERAAKQF
ncbi:ABC transporter substrate-binding protein [uncultured Tessaracoccus sp.]|uniref:ABC transporter substrate-binding protein n=1 Tax=uncultured Tessaracoccus sp. TaxID=905023 RepID=UPI0025DC724D|nr:ABC transporter substrate-binding protein [uncultured Tessaracoccus sp.]